ncbi:MAG: metallophosphoesterase [Euryarchaeota archaeon]|nr:metallophosphoesterase [Euryarchaeota archaeon]
MRLLCISDIHGSLESLPRVKGELEGADLIVLAGDITNFGGRQEVEGIVEEFLKLNPRLLAVPGNCDRPGVNEVLAERGISLHGTGRVIEGIGFFGTGGSNSTPFGTPQEYEEEELWGFLTRGHQMAVDAARLVMVSHSPPHGMRVDTTRAGVHAGSRKVREFVDAHQPDLVISGHIHEAKGTDTLGRSLLLNCGPFKAGCAKVEIGDKIGIELLEFR